MISIRLNPKQKIKEPPRMGNGKKELKTRKKRKEKKK